MVAQTPLHLLGKNSRACKTRRKCDERQRQATGSENKILVADRQGDCQTACEGGYNSGDEVRRRFKEKIKCL